MINDDQRLLLRIAQHYYLDGLTQAAIAERLRLSRQKVQRLLDQAHRDGIVQITFPPVMGVFADLERALETRFGLREVIVIETTAYDDQTVVAREVGAGAAEYLLRVVRPDDRIVISWGSTLLGLVNAVTAKPARKDLSTALVIQGLGGLADPNNEIHAADLTRRLARALGASAQLLPAPGVAGSRAAREAFYADRQIAQVLDRARRGTLAVMGIGAPRPESLLVREGTIVRWRELAELYKRGAVGDVNLRFFDARGQRVTSDLDDRVIGLDLDEIKQLHHVVGIAGGAAKLDALRGALAGNLIHALVTDHRTAQALLEPQPRARHAAARR